MQHHNDRPTALGVVVAEPLSVALRTTDLPSLTPDQVLIRTVRSMISPGTERTIYTGAFERQSHWGRWVTYPFRPGYSVAGVVVDVGRRVTSIARGDRVVAACPHQKPAVAHHTDVYPIPDDVDFDDAVWFALAIVAMTGVRNACQRLGDDVVVVGLGPIGQLVVQFARLQGARRVIVVGSPAKAAVALDHGATDAVVGRAATAPAEIRRLRPAGVDVGYDVTGQPDVLGDVLRCLRRFGRAVLVGDTGSPSAQTISGELLRQSLSVTGVHDSQVEAEPTASNGGWTRTRLVEHFFHLVERGDVRVSDLVTERWPIDQVGAAYRALTEPSGPLGALLDWA